MSPLVQIEPGVQKGGRKRLHVLTLTPFYPSARDEASGCFIAEPLSALEGAEVHNTVFAVQPIYRGRFRGGEAAVPAEWIRYFSLPGGFGLPTAGAFLFARIVSHVRELHGKDPINLIHAHGPLPCGHAAMLLSRELGIPYVVSVHGLDVLSTIQVTSKAGEWCERISKRAYAASRRVICVSEHVREKVLEGMGRACRTSVVYNGVDPQVFFPPEEGARDTSLILSVGNLIPIKGHDVLIRAVASLVSEFGSIHLEIIGEGVELPRLRALAEQLQVSDRVQFRGRQTRAAVADAMRRCTIFALPSRYEALGCVYLEAMCVGKPVIGCRGQGISEIIDHGSNGFLVGPDNDKELALALAMLLRDQSRRRALGTAARDTILDSFTLKDQAQKLLPIYRECAA